MVEGGMKCVKYLLFAFNLVFVLAAIGLIVAGALVQTRFHSYFDIFGDKFNGAAILLIVVGVVIFMIATFGCCGAIKENYICTMTFAGLLVVVFILEIGGGIAGFVLRNEVEGFVSEKLTESMDKYNATTPNALTDTWNTLQADNECCGTYNYTDWQNTPLSPSRDHLVVPASCCKEANCTIVDPNAGDLWGEGCLTFLEQWVKENIAIIGGVGIGLAFVQILGIIFACCLARSIRKEYEVV